MNRMDFNACVLDASRSDTDSVASELTLEERIRLQQEEEALHASSLRIPRRYNAIAAHNNDRVSI